MGKKKRLRDFYDLRREKYYWMLISGIWFILSVLMSAQILMSYARNGNPLAWYKPFLMEGVYCFLWAISAPICLYYANKFSLKPGRNTIIIPVHLFTGFFSCCPHYDDKDHISLAGS